MTVSQISQFPVTSGRLISEIHHRTPLEQASSRTGSSEHQCCFSRLQAYKHSRATEVAFPWALHSPLSGKLCVRITWVDTGGEKKGEEPQNNYLNELRFLLYLNIDTFSSAPQGIIFTMNIKSSLTHKIIAPALQLHRTCLGVINGSE